ncbi:DUF3606 domain-containing protein [Mesorhizobium sp. BAC0120]|uniref:DUF3606 domain-containing protein n=1 Tax=Mesorhizobium sp. BAC0120 TaxID=3090670 RepID=UPI00298C0B74|nr:DUF3606 domain-containing protein [Mesorhizobium sp. BAC0120]MDW6026666.1 DUF3606 domain-containing protein [Mesorhizobium sp. BAC0120]
MWIRNEADNGRRTKKDRHDRERVAGGENYEINYLMKRTGVRRAEAIGLIRQFGNDRKTLEKEAKKLLR